MLELTRELHKKEYCNNEAIKLDFEAIKELIPFKIALKQGFYEAFECKVCGLGMMTELLGCGLKYSCVAAARAPGGRHRRPRCCPRNCA